MDTAIANMHPQGMEPARSHFPYPADAVEKRVIYLMDDDLPLLRTLGRRFRESGSDVETFDSAR